MDYWVPCNCGGSVVVLASQAGDSVACQSCGAIVHVPQLSQLRQLANLHPYESSPIDTIGRLIEEGKLPEGPNCMTCGMTTSDQLLVRVECESVWVRQRDTGVGPLALLMGMMGPIGLILHRITEKREFHGRNTEIFVPIRLDADCARRLTRRRLSKLLKSVPIYASLLAEYPAAKLSIAEQPMRKQIADEFFA